MTILFSCSASAQTVFDFTYEWPLKIAKKFSSGFGDARPGRFHMGVDLRTNGEVGTQVFAPEDGYVYRFSTSYRGYGKALYIKGESGRIYVFGHLLRYNWDIGTYLWDKQIQSKRYYQDFYLEKDELPIKKGEFIARTGQTGAGAPHLHFEVRENENTPTNPLSYNVKVGDDTPPAFRAIWLTSLDDSILFNDGVRELKLQPKFDKKTGTYIVADTVGVSGRFGLKAAIDDVIGQGSFLLGPVRIRLTIDGKLYHAVTFDRLTFDENRYAKLDRDYDPAKEDYKRVYNLFRKPGNELTNYAFDVPGDGTFRSGDGGLHTAVIEAADASGNSSRCTFAFYYMNSLDILEPFNRAEFSDSMIALMYAGGVGLDAFDSAEMVLSHQDIAKGTSDVVLFPEILPEENMLRLKGTFRSDINYELRFYKDGVCYPSYYFSTRPIQPNGQRAIDSFDISIIEGTILVTAMAHQPGVNWLQAEIITDTGSDRRFFRKSGDRRFSLAYHPGGDVSVIESIITRGPVGFGPDSNQVAIYRIKPARATVTEILPWADMNFEKRDLFDTILLYGRDTLVPGPISGFYLREPVFVGPATASFADWVEVQTVLDPGDIDPVKIGLYVFDEKEGWLWGGGEFDRSDNILRSSLGGSGIVAIIADTTAPVITQLNIEENAWLKSSHPEIRFHLEDELSGIENDLSFNVTIDDIWMVPEYDPERGDFIAKPHWRLTGGRHHLHIEVTDRCGNRAVVERKFRIRSVVGP